MTASRKRRRPLLGAETSAALEREKALFVSRNASRCSRLLVRIEPDSRRRRLSISAVFALDEKRDWKRIEVMVSADELHREVGPDRGLIAAFGQLDDEISAARIARLFAPAPIAERITAGRA